MGGAELIIAPSDDGCEVIDRIMMVMDHTITKRGQCESTQKVATCLTTVPNTSLEMCKRIQNATVSTKMRLESEFFRCIFRSVTRKD